MRKFLFTLCIFFFVMLTVKGQTFTVKENGIKISYKILSQIDKTVELKRASGSGMLNIPDQVNYKGTIYNVVSIGYMAATNAFGIGGAKFNFINIPKSVKEIGICAFGVSPVYEVSLAQGIRTIESEAFCGTKITSIIIPEGVEEIGKSCFYDTPLETIYIPNTIKNIGKEAFGSSKNPKILKILNLPAMINESNCESFGISKASVASYLASHHQQANPQTPVVQQPAVAETKPLPPIATEKPKQPQQQIATVSDVDINIPMVSADNSNTFAIIFANENYQEETKVDYALNDGETFKNYCHKVLGLPLKNIHIRKDATLNNMRSELIWMQKVANAYQGEAKIIVYYAGHGIPDEKTGNAYLLPVDGNGSVIETGYSLQKLYQQLGDLPAKNVTVFMDACFSGAKRGEGMLASARGVAIKAKAQTPKGHMVVFSAAQGDETAYPLSEQQHGLFTYYLLKKLKETKGDATYEELYNYIQKQVGRTSIVDNGKSQTPTVTPSVSVANSWKTMKLK